MSVETSTSSALLRRAQFAGVAGFVGLGSVLRGTQLTAAARRAQLAEQASGTARSPRA